MFDSLFLMVGGNISSGLPGMFHTDWVACFTRNPGMFRPDFPNNGTNMIAPGFLMKKWTKKDIIKLYNETKNGKNNPYNKNISNIKLDVLIKEICNLMEA